MKHARWPLLPALALLAATTAQASQVYRWTDPQGRAHYADRVDGTATGDVSRIALPAGPTVVARLRVEADAHGVLAWVDNLLAGPIEVMLHAEGDDVSSDPPLPARGTVPALSAGLLARVGAGNPRLRVIAVPGTPNARPRDVEYGWPLQTASVRIQQAWNGSFSHADGENRHAVDFAAPSGTAVLAARDGVVMQSEAGFAEASPGEDEDELVARANFIRILHDDGTMALYAHLQTGGVLVRLGQHVRRGQVIGLSGNTGRSTAPHLHFVVQANRGMRLASVPFRMFGPQGILRFGTMQDGGG
ncbi:peptidoglycan DD-metalloendopeptidase family protein [Luteimonas kalidii]|uniref:Peptidoglycan DD-metalloendopeptidase family protein n=1 Tax=Luteimonas kalidii TaxID=3042025 RepID=A0ABT6JVR2_9GAMM|nr:peptidoglycan DD-metalloendopeptidase family protein [Luteimonas kalidii]MDH5834674.1 peptidoglycan DD-metalloendopeptidase family protein [Luteimonas kalidii]